MRFIYSQIIYFSMSSQDNYDVAVKSARGRGGEDSGQVPGLSQPERSRPPDVLVEIGPSRLVEPSLVLVPPSQQDRLA